jgi:hypothetical protein
MGDALGHRLPRGVAQSVDRRIVERDDRHAVVDPVVRRHIAAFVSPASLECSDAEVVRYVGYAALAVLTIVAVSLVMKVLAARPH